MSNVTKPMLLDETGQRIAAALERIAENGGGGSSSGTSIYRHDVYFEDYLDENKGYSFVICTDSNTPIQTFEGIHAIVTALCGEHHWLSIHDENGNGQVITGVDGATTITSNLHDWTSSDIQNINDKVTPVGNGGGSSGGGSGSAYVVSYYDMLDATGSKHIDVEKLIELGTAKVAGFSSIEITIGGTTFVDLISTNIDVTPYVAPILRFTADSDNHVEIYVNGDYLRTENTTSNLVEVLTLNKALIEGTDLTLSNDNNQDRYVGIVGIFTDDNTFPYTVDEFKTLFKEVETTTEQTI